MTEPRITMDTVRRSGHCFAGVRAACTEKGIDVRRLAREGIPVSELDGIEDVYFKQIIELAKAEGEK